MKSFIATAVWRYVFALILLILMAPIEVAYSQGADVATGRAERAYEDLTAKIDEVRTSLQSIAITDEDLDKARNQLEVLRTEALAEQSEVARPLNDAQAQLKKLGDPPGEGETEAPSITEERKALSSSVAPARGGVETARPPGAGRRTTLDTGGRAPARGFRQAHFQRQPFGPEPLVVV